MREDGDSIRAVARALTVLRLFDEAGTRLGLGEIAVTTGLAKSTLNRLLGTLEAEGMLSRDPDGRYGPGLELMRWSTLASDLLTVPEPVLEEMAGVALELGESVTLYIRRGTDRIALARAESRRTLRHIVPLHTPMPLYSGAASWVLLGEADDALLTQVQRLADDHGRSVDVTARVAAARADGYARSDGEREEGVTGLAVPVARVAAVSVGGPTDRFNPALTHSALGRLMALSRAAAPHLQALAPPPRSTT